MSLSRFSSSLSTNTDVQSAIDEICQKIKTDLAAVPDLLAVFFSRDFNDHSQQLLSGLKNQLAPRNVIGCCGESIIGTGREVENQPAISVLAGCLPELELTPMYLQFEHSTDGAAIVGWPDDVDAIMTDGAGIVLLADPFSFPADVLLERANEDWPGVAVSGGVASACEIPGEARLLLNDQVVNTGAVAVHFEPSVHFSTVVSQGCRPIGEPMIVTQVEGNEICELGGKPALDQLQLIFDRLPNRDKSALQQGLHVGRVVNEYQAEFEQGDFLIRNVMNVDQDNGRIAVGDYFRIGQTVQFQIRDEQSADHEMRQLLQSVTEQHPPAGGLMFSCNGRGSNMFSVPDHDAALVQETMGDIPISGFFAAGEIGAIGGRNYLHGFTASSLFFH